MISASHERCLDPIPLEPPILDKLINAKLAKNREQSSNSHAHWTWKNRQDILLILLQFAFNLFSCLHFTYRSLDCKQLGWILTWSCYLPRVLSGLKSASLLNQQVIIISWMVKLIHIKKTRWNIAQSNWTLAANPYWFSARQSLPYPGYVVFLNLE